jgi:F-type H+-transporting ATPase subunit delta
MKTPKEARKLARSLFRSSFVEGRIDRARVTALVEQTIAAKPRQYISALKELLRLVRLELQRRHTIIESAIPLEPAVAESVLHDLQARYGSDITSEFRVNAELIAGLRVKLGSDVWDGSVRGRLTRLQENLNRAQLF